MPKQLMWANVHVPQYPRVRFFIRTPDPNQFFQDVTHRVAKLVVEDQQESGGYCALLRLDDQDKLVWKTQHPSLQEMKWHAEFEYGLPEDKWIIYNNPAS